MAQRTSTIVVDDLTAAELGDDAVTVAFALEGGAYEIDLAPTVERAQIAGFDCRSSFGDQGF